jgi:hypothetical protein
MWQIAADLPVPRYVVADEGRMLPETVPISLTLEERKGAFMNMCQQSNIQKSQDHMQVAMTTCLDIN